MKSFKMSFEYLGNRDYLDISSITDSFWQNFGTEKRTLVRNFEFKLLKPIDVECIFCYDEIGKIEFSNKKKSLATIKWELGGKEYLGFFNGTEIKISKRRTEENFSFENHCEVLDQKVKLKRLFSADTCYNLMKMGKFLIGRSDNPNVRVVKYFMRHFMPAEELINSEVNLTSLWGNDFFKLHCTKNSDEFGYIIVKRAPPEGVA
jgi:hypothetical protein